MKVKMYNQCRVRKGNSIMITWLPTALAKVGNIVNLKEADAWVNGWKILSVGGAISEEKLKEQEKRYRSGDHRKGSDI